jgi:hypothetical protein
MFFHLSKNNPFNPTQYLPEFGKLPGVVNKLLFLFEFFMFLAYETCRTCDEIRRKFSNGSAKAPEEAFELDGAEDGPGVEGYGIRWKVMGEGCYGDFKNGFWKIE